MFDDKEFPNVFLDERVAENALWSKTKAEIERLERDRTKGISLAREVALLASKATLPAGVKARMSISTGGTISITLTDLESFHDTSELVGVLFNEYKTEYTPSVQYYDYPEKKTRVFSISNWNRGVHIDINAVLDEERGECKILTKGIKQPTYIPQATMDQEIICPGDPRYDDI